MQESPIEQPTNRKPSQNRQSPWSKAIPLIVVVGVVAVLGFFAFSYVKSKNTASANTTQSGGMAGRGFGGQGGRGFQNGNRAIGTVTSVSSTSIAITTRSGTSSSYTISASTTVTNNGQGASVSDIKSGDKVLITLDATGSTNASSIALNPSFGGGQNNGSTNPPTSST